MTHFWQKIDEAWHLCHCWQDLCGSKLSAMNDTIILALLISIAVLGALAALSTVHVRHDGTLGHGSRPASRRTRPEDVYMPYLLNRDLYHR